MNPSGEMVLKNTGIDVFSAPVFRGGFKGIFSFDVLQAEGSSPSLTVAVQTKNTADNLDSGAGGWNDVSGASANPTGTGLNAIIASELKEQVRLRFNMGGGASAWMRIFVFEPSWQ